MIEYPYKWVKHGFSLHMGHNKVALYFVSCAYQKIVTPLLDNKIVSNMAKVTDNSDSNAIQDEVESNMVNVPDSMPR